jgi:hypothetical protein
MSHTKPSKLEEILKSVITEGMAKQYLIETEGYPNDAEAQHYLSTEAGKEYQTMLVKKAEKVIEPLITHAEEQAELRGRRDELKKLPTPKIDHINRASTNANRARTKQGAFVFGARFVRNYVNDHKGERLAELDRINGGKDD